MSDQPVAAGAVTAGERGRGTGIEAVAIVLAAGQATRFGDTKQLALQEGLPLVAHAVRCAHQAGCARVLVVVGHDGRRVGLAAGRGGAVDVVPNPRYREGQSTSVKAGIAAARSGQEQVAVVLLADQPGIAPSVVTRVVEAVAQPPGVAARARYQDGVGHPVAFARAFWPRLLQLTGDQGARELLTTVPVVEVEMPGAAPLDVDTPGGLRDAVEGSSSRLL